MKKRLLVLSLVLSMFLVACGSEVKQISSDTSTKKEKTETVEVESDAEETTEEETEVDTSTVDTNSNTLLEKTYDFGETGTIKLEFVDNNGIELHTYIHTDDIKELSIATSYWYMFSNRILDEIDLTKDYMLTAGQTNGSALFIASSAFFQSTEEDGTANAINTLPEWFNELPDDTDSYSDRFSEIWTDFSNAFADKYSE